MKVKYCGCAKDYSGYGEANRHDIAALANVGVELTTEIPVYTPEASDYGKLGQIAVENENRAIGYRIKIIHTTPNVYRQYFESGKYQIGRVFWETDKLPLDFAQYLPLMNEIWTGSKFNENAIRKAGVNKIPIYIIPEAIDDTLEIDKVIPYITDNQKTFKFYSIFEWTERKNPKGLLEAYWRAFEGVAGVSLMLKVYVDNFKPEKKDEINRDIKKLKLQLGLKSYAPVYMYRELMTRSQIYRFHKTGDCFISLHRGEGWGIPQMEAMLLEKPIISTNIGGIHEYLEDNKNALLIPYQLAPVQNSRNAQWYTPDQQWANPDLNEAIKKMQWVFKNKSKAKIIGKNARLLVKSRFGLTVVGGLMKARLTEIQNNILDNQEI